MNHSKPDPTKSGARTARPVPTEDETGNRTDARTDGGADPHGARNQRSKCCNAEITVAFYGRLICSDCRGEVTTNKGTARTGGGEDITRPDHRYASDLMAPVHLTREDDTLKARYYEGSGINERPGELISVTREPDDAGPGLSGYGTLNIRPRELDDYITILTALRDAMDERATDGEDGAEPEVRTDGGNSLPSGFHRCPGCGTPTDLLPIPLRTYANGTKAAEISLCQLCREGLAEWFSDRYESEPEGEVRTDGGEPSRMPVTLTHRARVGAREVCDGADGHTCGRELIRGQHCIHITEYGPGADRSGRRVLCGECKDRQTALNIADTPDLAGLYREELPVLRERFPDILADVDTELETEPEGDADE